MIYLITGASHTGKTYLAQKLLEKLHISALSQDHLKMGLIRSGQINLTVYDDEKLVEVLWPITKEIIKTAIENHQHLIVEGCYIPSSWKNDFDKNYIEEIQSVCLIMSQKYIENYSKQIEDYGDVIEIRLDKTINKGELMKDNLIRLKECDRMGLPYVLVDEKYDAVEQAMRLFQLIEK